MKFKQPTLKLPCWEQRTEVPYLSFPSFPKPQNAVWMFAPLPLNEFQGEESPHPLLVRPRPARRYFGSTGWKTIVPSNNQRERAHPTHTLKLFAKSTTEWMLPDARRTVPSKYKPCGPRQPLRQKRESDPPRQKKVKTSLLQLSLAKAGNPRVKETFDKLKSPLELICVYYWEIKRKALEGRGIPSALQTPFFKLLACCHQHLSGERGGGEKSRGSVSSSSPGN